MMLTGFLFLLLFTGGSTSNHSEQAQPLDDDEEFDSFEEGGSTSNNSEILDDQQKSNYTFVQHVTEDLRMTIYRVMDKVPPKCTHQDIVKYLKLTQNNGRSMTRPGSAESPTLVILDVLIYAILDVNEKDQKFVSYVWVDMWWWLDDMSWDPKDFCGTKKIYIPTKLMWKPDITIEEMTEKDKALPTEYVIVYSSGRVFLRNDMMVISTCRMQVNKFPFDVQSCTLTFKSLVFSDEDIQLFQTGGPSRITEWSKKMMRTQSEWVFMDMTVNNKTVDNFGINQIMVVYTITMRRRSLLYIVNFILPILFFFCLDLASFLISDSGGEKLGFKVTVMLAVTVMQLILNDILPSSSDRIPIIAMFCIGIFGLMMLSLMETMLVIYVLEKDNEADKDQNLSEESGDERGKVSFRNCCREVKKSTHCICGVSPESELLPATKESSSNQLTGDYDSEKLSNELKEVEKTVTLLLSSRKEEKKRGYWTRVAKTINKVFFIFYVTAAVVFLLCMLLRWITVEE